MTINIVSQSVHNRFKRFTQLLFNMNKQRLFIIVSLLLLAIFFLGCTSSDTTSNAVSNTNTNNTTNNDSNSSPTTTAQPTATPPINNEQAILDAVSTNPFATNTTCPNFGFGDWSQNLYFTLAKNVLPNNPGKTAEDYFTGGFVVENIPNPLPDDWKDFSGTGVNKSLVCHKGTKSGENANYMYCDSFAVQKKPVSETGEIQNSIRYIMTPVFYIKNAVLTPINSIDINMIPNNGTVHYEPGDLTYKITSARQTGFACEKMELPY